MRNRCAYCLPPYFFCGDMKKLIFILCVLTGCSTEQVPKNISNESEKSVGYDSSKIQYQIGFDNTETYGDSCSYWYVFYTARRKNPDDTWSGYKVIKLDKPYFNVSEAIKIIYPSYTDDDYVGIEFFKEVTERTYIDADKEK